MAVNAATGTKHEDPQQRAKNGAKTIELNKQGAVKGILDKKLCVIELLQSIGPGEKTKRINITPNLWPIRKPDRRAKNCNA